MLRSLFSSSAAKLPPIFLSPMANAGGVKLAVAIGSLGGVPSLPGAAMSTDDLRQSIHTIRSAGYEPIVNFFAHTVLTPRLLEDDARWLRSLRPLYEAHGLSCDAKVFQTDAVLPADRKDALTIEDFPPWFAQSAGRNPFDLASLQLVVEEQLRMVSFHFGLPRGLPSAAPPSTGDSKSLLAEHASFLAEFRRAVGAGVGAAATAPHISVLSSATSVEECLHLYAAGVDGIILQGCEAGGHRGNFLTDITPDGHMSTVELVRQAREAVVALRASNSCGGVKSGDSVVLIAAGGIATHQDVLAALGAGADAVQVGTAFLNCHESVIPSLYRKRLQDGAQFKGHQTPTTAVTAGFTGRPARALVNEVARFVPLVAASTADSAADRPPAFPTAVDGWTSLRKLLEPIGDDSFTPMMCGAKVEESCFGATRSAEVVMASLLGPAS